MPDKREDGKGWKPNVDHLPDIAKERIRQMVGVWFQTSVKHRHVCRLPQGMTGKQALREGERRSEHPHPDLNRWVDNLGERSAGDHFLRCHADRWKPEVLSLQLTIDEFAYYRQMGGGTYMQSGPAKVPGMWWDVYVWSKVEGDESLTRIGGVQAMDSDSAVSELMSPIWRFEYETETDEGIQFVFSALDCTARPEVKVVAIERRQPCSSES